MSASAHWQTSQVPELVSGVICCCRLRSQCVDKLNGSADSDGAPKLKARCNLQVWVKQMGSLDRLLAAAELPAAALLSLADSSPHSGCNPGCDEAAMQQQALAAPACSALSADHQYCARDLAVEMDLAKGLSSAAEGSRHQDRQKAAASRLLLHVSLQYTCGPVQALQGAEQSAQSVQSMPVQDAADVEHTGALWQVHEQESAQENACFLDLGGVLAFAHAATSGSSIICLIFCHRMLHLLVLHAPHRQHPTMWILQQAAEFWCSYSCAGMVSLPLRT